MSAKEYLSEIITLKKAVDALEDKVELLRVQAANIKAIKYDKDRVQVSEGYTLEDSVIALIDAEKEYTDVIAKYHKAVKIRIKQIAGMDNQNYSQVLMLRYVVDNDGRRQSLEDIAEQMYMSLDRIKHLHGEALEEFERKYKC